MKELPLVSVIIPCYNGEKVMGRLLDSLLNQTYNHLEIILINDGSSDNSEQIWCLYEKKFNKENIKTKYIYHENQGLGATINAGLKVVTGEYFCWPDIDDYLDLQSIEKRVMFLEQNPEFGSVSSDAYCYNEEDLAHPVSRIAEWMTHKYDVWQFRHLLEGQSIYCPGCHMVRTKCFRDTNPDMQIYPARRGQNNQMLLPIYYKYKHGYIDEPLYNYILYNKSMSSTDETYERAMDRAKEYSDIITYTLNMIKMDEDNVKYCSKQKRKMEWDNYSNIYIRFGKPIKFLKIYLKLKIYKTDQKIEIKRGILSLINKIKRGL